MQTEIKTIISVSFTFKAINKSQAECFYSCQIGKLSSLTNDDVIAEFVLIVEKSLTTITTLSILTRI